jgi:hypothetical protein
MDKLKVPLCLYVREDVWKGLREVAEREGKKLSQLTEQLLEWGVVQVKTTGSALRLLDFSLRPPNARRKN